MDCGDLDGEERQEEGRRVYDGVAKVGKHYSVDPTSSDYVQSFRSNTEMTKHRVVVYGVSITE